MMKALVEDLETIYNVQVKSKSSMKKQNVKRKKQRNREEGIMKIAHQMLAMQHKAVVIEANLLLPHSKPMLLISLEQQLNHGVLVEICLQPLLHLHFGKRMRRVGNLQATHNR
jgi:hypothetical protein